MTTKHSAEELANYLINFVLGLDDYEESKHTKSADILRKQKLENQIKDEANGVLIIRLGQLQDENAKLDREVTRYKMAWNMAEDTIEKLKETISELEYVNGFGDLEKER